MGRRRVSKRPRGSRHAPCIHDQNIAHRCHDMFVPLPKASTAAESQIQSKLLMRQILDRLAFTGYNTAAVSHVVYGRPKPGVDHPDKVFPSFSWEEGDDKEADEATKKAQKRRRTQKGINKKQPIDILRRLHAIVENLSDIAVYNSPPLSERSTQNSGITGLLDDYDLVSISPRNDAAFQAACASATAAKILTLDYTSGRGGVQLPFRIRSVDIKALVERGAVIELPYAPALLHPNKRKALVQTARELQMASVSVQPKPRIIFSSGDRTVGEIDSGAMALRSPGDLVNILQTVLRFDQTTSYDAFCGLGTYSFSSCTQGTIGGLAGDLVSLERKTESKSKEVPEQTKAEDNASTVLAQEKEAAAEEADTVDDDAMDGFITLV